MHDDSNAKVATVDKTRTIDISKFKNVSVKSFTLKELSDEEEQAAWERATGTDGKVSQYQLSGQLLSEAIVAVDGEPVPTRPWSGWKKWNSRTREMATKAYKAVHDLTATENADFEKALLGS